MGIPGVVAALALSGLFGYLGIRWIRDPELEGLGSVIHSDKYSSVFAALAPLAALASSLLLIVYTLFAVT